MPDKNLAITALIRRRCEELGLAPADLVLRCGYKNISKGLRRIEEICRGSFAGGHALLRALPAALEVPTEAVTRAVEDTRRQLHEAQEEAWRAAFKPHAIILTERKIPEPIFVAAFIGVDRLLHVDFDLQKGPISYVKQALDVLGKKLNAWGSDQLPAFGRPTGVVVNYTPVRAVRFDLSGKPIAILDRAHRVGDASLSIGKHPISSRELEAILFGGSQKEDMTP